MADWTQTTHGFQVQVSTVPVSGTDATLSGITPFLRFTDTEAGHEDFRLYVDADVFQIDWLSGTGPDVWTNILKITDPTIAVPILEFNKYTLKLKNLDAAAGTKAIHIIVGVEANERWNIENTGEQNWGPGGATAPDTTLSRVAVGVLQTEMLRVLADPSVANDVSRKNYVDVQIDGRVAVAGDTMTGLLTLSGNPTAALHAATKQYVDALLPAGGAVAKAGDTMTGTLTFDLAANGTVLQTKIASEANPRFRFDANGKIEWGPGGAGALDAVLERISAATLKITGSLGIGISDPTIGVNQTLNVAFFGNPVVGFKLVGRRTIDSDFATFSFINNPSGSTYHELVRLEAQRAGADNSGLLQIRVMNAGVLSEAGRVDASGNLHIGAQASIPVSGKIRVTNTTTVFSAKHTGSGGAVAQFEVTDVTWADNVFQVTLPAALGNYFSGTATGGLPFVVDSLGRLRLGSGTISGLVDASIHLISSGNPGVKIERTNAVARKYLVYIGSDGRLSFQDDTAVAERMTLDVDGMFSLYKSLATRVVSPVQIVANQDNYDPGKEGFWRINSDAARNITGIAGGIDGRSLVIYNIGAFAITFTHQDAASTAANRFLFSTGANIAVAAGAYIKLIYDSVTTRWREIT